MADEQNLWMQPSPNWPCPGGAMIASSSRLCATGWRPAGRLRVVVAGESQRGESTLINALLGQAVLPTGARR